MATTSTETATEQSPPASTTASTDETPHLELNETVKTTQPANEEGGEAGASNTKENNSNIWNGNQSPVDNAATSPTSITDAATVTPEKGGRPVPSSAEDHEGKNCVESDASLSHTDHTSVLVTPEADRRHSSSSNGGDVQSVEKEATTEVDTGSTTTTAETYTASTTFHTLKLPTSTIPENSTTSTSTTGTLSVRERLRARLREQEQKLSKIVRSTSGDGTESYVTKIKKVQDSIKQMEQEKSELEKELTRLKHATDDDEFLKEKMTSIQDGFEKQVKKIQSLQHEIGSKNNEIDMLRTELVKKLKRIVELEFDLQTHDVHYTEYAEEQFKLGEEALAEIKTMKAQRGEEKCLDDDMSIMSSVSACNTIHGMQVAAIKTPRKAQKLISKLLTDLDNLEVRYKEEKLMNSAMIEKLSLTNNDLQTKVEILEKRLKQYTGSAIERDIDSHSKEADTFEMQNANFLRRRVDTLDAKKALYMREIEKLRCQLEDTRKDASAEAKRTEYTVTRLMQENQAMRTHIDQIENKGRRRKPIIEQANEQYLAIVRKIEESYKVITRLQNSVEIKDRQISTLKKEVANLRMKEIQDGNIRGTPYSRIDTDLLRSSSSMIYANQMRSSMMSSASSRSLDSREFSTVDDTQSYIVELQKQLHEAQQMLVKKDQELVIERAKAASTAAGLLARITELTGQKVDTSNKHVPRRFYL